MRCTDLQLAFEARGTLTNGEPLLVPSINSSALTYLNISANPGTLSSHDYFASIGYKNHSLDPQVSPGPGPRKSRPSSTTRGLEPFGQKATTHTHLTGCSGWCYLESGVTGPRLSSLCSPRRLSAGTDEGFRCYWAWKSKVQRPRTSLHRSHGTGSHSKHESGQSFVGSTTDSRGTAQTRYSRLPSDRVQVYDSRPQAPITIVADISQQSPYPTSSQLISSLCPQPPFASSMFSSCCPTSVDRVHSFQYNRTSNGSMDSTTNQSKPFPLRPHHDTYLLRDRDGIYGEDLSAPSRLGWGSSRCAPHPDPRGRILMWSASSDQCVGSVSTI